MNMQKLPTWFWVLAALAAVWNLLGVGAYLADVTMSPEALQKLTEAERELRAATPALVTGAYAIAVFAGLLAAVALLLRRKSATALFAISLLAVILQMGYLFVLMNAGSVLGSGAIVFPLIIIVLGALLLWFSIAANNNGWLR